LKAEKSSRGRSRDEEGGFDPFAPFLRLFGKLYGEGAAFAATATTPKGERLLLLQGVGARPLQLARGVGTRPLDVALSIMEPK